MPRYEITAPDGRKFEVNAPEGATLEDAIAWAQQNQDKIVAMPQEGAPAAEEPAPPPPAPAPDRRRVFNGRDPSLQDVVVQGVTFGLSNDAEGAAAAAGPALRKVGKAVGLPVEYREGEVGEAYSRGRNEAIRRADRYREENPWTAFGGDILGGFANPLARLWAPAGAPSAAAPGLFRFLSPSTWRTPPRATPPATPGAPVFFPPAAAGAAPTQPVGILNQVGRGVAVGAPVGALTGFNQAEGELDDRIVGGGTGAVIGGAIGAAAPALIEGGSAGFRWLLDQTIRRANNNAATPASRKVVEALRRDGLTPEEAVQRARELGPDGMLADVGENTRALAGSVMRTPGKGKTELTNRIVARQEGTRDAEGNLVGGQYARVKNFIEGIQPMGLRQALDETAAARSGNAAPLYQKAFSGGSTAPLETQLGDQFATASSATAQARQAVAAAEQKMTLAAAQASQAGDNVYANSSANQARAAAQAELDAAQAALQSAEGREAAILERLRQAQTDRATNRPGAVWSPEIQMLLDDPVAQRGLASSVATQRKEHLARVLRGEANEPFNPAELAITGFDANGNPIVGNVPNLRTLDGIKRGLDAELDAARDPLTGRIVWNENLRAVDQVRSALIDKLDELTGGATGPYAQARASWAEPSKLMDAAKMGRHYRTFENNDEMKHAMKYMSDAEKHYFRIGMFQDMMNQAGNTVTRGDITKKLLDIPGLEEKIKTAFGSREEFARYVRFMQNERAKFNTYAEGVGNSKTAARQAADEDATQDPGGLVSSLIGLANSPGNPLPWWNVIREGGRYLNSRVGMTEPARNEVARFLGGQDIGALNQTMRSEMLREDIRGALSRAGTLMTVPAATGQAP